MAFDLFKKTTNERNYGRELFVIGLDVRDIPTSEQKKKAREWLYSSAISVGLGVVSGLLTHVILLKKGNSTTTTRARGNAGESR